MTGFSSRRYKFADTTHKEMDTLQDFKILTITHKQARLEEIGKYVFSDTPDDEALRQKLESLKLKLGLKEFLYLATCNRVMFFFLSAHDLQDAFVSAFFKEAFPHLDAEEVERATTMVARFSGREAIQHLFQVSSSVNSLVVGEREILRQLRSAYEQCHELGTTGDSIRVAMRFAVEAAKTVYSQTRIGEKPISVVSLAMQQMRNSNLVPNPRFLIVGAGQTNKLVAKFLKKYEYDNFTVFNRTYEKAEELARFLGAEAASLEALADYDKGFDALIVCTGATEPIITQPLYEQLLQGDKRDKVVIDLSIPNNVDKQLAEVYDMNYIEVEGLRQLANENLDFRKREVERAKQLLVEAIKEFELHFQSRQVTRVLSTVPNQIKAVKQHALDNVFKNELSGLDDASLELVERMMSYMERRCIGIPMKAAKDALEKYS